MMQNQLPKESNIGESFARLIDDIYVKHKGCLITKELNGYSWGGEFFHTIEEAKEKIDGIKLKNIQPPPDYHKTHISATLVDKDGSETELSESNKAQYLIGNSAYNDYKKPNQP